MKKINGSAAVQWDVTAPTPDEVLPVYKTYDWFEYCFLKAQGYQRIVYARKEKS